MTLTPNADRPDFQPLSPREYLNGPVRPELTQLVKTVQDAGPQTLNRVNTMSQPQRVQTLQEYVERQRQYYQHTIFDIARTQHAQLQPEIALMRTQIPFPGTRIDQILDRLGAAPPDPIRDDNGNLTNITFPPQTYLKHCSEQAGLITQAVTGNTNIGCIIDAPKVKEDIDFLDTLKGQATPAQVAFLESLKKKLIDYSTALDAQNIQQWLRPRSQMDQAALKFGRLAVFLALSVGAIVNGVISLRNKSSPTAALLMAGGAFFAANPGFLSPADQRSLDDANRARFLLQDIVNSYDIQGLAWKRICDRVLTPSPALKAFMKQQPGPVSNLLRGNTVINLDDDTKESLFVDLASASPRKADDRIDRDALTNKMDRDRYDMIIARPREFFTLVTTLSGLRGEARKYALTSIEIGAWRQQPQAPQPLPQPQLPPNVA